MPRTTEGFIDDASQPSGVTMQEMRRGFVGQAVGPETPSGEDMPETPRFSEQEGITPRRLRPAAGKHARIRSDNSSHRR